MEVLEVAVPRERFPLAALYISCCPGAAYTWGFPVLLRACECSLCWDRGFGWSSPALPECSGIVQAVLARNADAGEWIKWERKERACLCHPFQRAEEGISSLQREFHCSAGPQAQASGASGNLVIDEPVLLSSAVALQKALASCLVWKDWIRC